jgi:hypothetical protein
LDAFFFFTGRPIGRPFLNVITMMSFLMLGGHVDVLLQKS